MENFISQIVIMNVYKRKAEGKYLKKLVDISAKEYGIPSMISMDDGSLGVWKNFCNCLTMGGGIEDKPFRIVLQDDVSFDRNILNKIQYILQFAPKDKIVVIYNPTNNDYLECAKSGKHILTTDINFWLQGAIYPNSVMKDFVAEMDVAAKANRNDDDRLSAWLQAHKDKLFVVVPSLIQHYGAFRSNFKVGGKVAGIIRNSSTYDNQFDVESVDWEEEFRNPFIAKMRKDYVKQVMREEFLEEFGKF